MKLDRISKLLILSALATVLFKSACASYRPTSLRRDGPAIEVIVDATELAAAFEENESAALELFSGKRGRIRGQLAKYESLANGNVAMTFKTSLDTFRPVRCVFEPAESARLNELETGEDLSVIGDIVGFSESRYFVTVADCTIN